MSSEKKVSWKKGKSVWRGRLYLPSDVMDNIRRTAKDEDREPVYVMCRALEQKFGGEQRNGANEKAANK